MKILVINGPNLNFLGIRETEIYGEYDYDYVSQVIRKKASDENVLVELYQSNHEGDIIDRIQQSYFDETDALIINPGAYAHYSYAIHDALTSIRIPKAEVHISDITKRKEEWRHNSVTAEACDTIIMGRGIDGYCDAIDFVLDLFNKRAQQK